MFALKNVEGVQAVVSRAKVALTDMDGRAWVVASIAVMKLWHSPCYSLSNISAAVLGYQRTKREISAIKKVGGVWG